MGFLSRLFKKKEKIADDAVPEEYWQSDFSKPDRRRFVEEEGEGYRSFFSDGRYKIELAKPRLLAWGMDWLYRYADFALEARIGFGASDAYCAAGVLFRYESEANFYSLAVSNKSMFRLDLIFNGSPRALIPWTECPEPLGAEFGLKLIAKGGRFTVVVDDLWAGEAEDDSFGVGSVAFAAQHFADAGLAEAELFAIGIESRGIEVEALHYRWNSYIKPDPDARLVLAESLAAGGMLLPALVQLRKRWKEKEAGRRDLMLAAACALGLSLHGEASSYLDLLIAQEPDNAEALAARANLLYLQGSYLELRGYLDEIGRRGVAGPFIDNLRGHAEYSLGNWAAAFEAYGRAALAEPARGIYALNAARALDELENAPDAGDRVVGDSFDWYLRAAKALYRAGEVDDCAQALARAREEEPGSREVAALDAALLYAEGRVDESLARFSPLIEAGLDDPVAWYLTGLVLRDRGQRREAVRRFERAALLDPASALYRFRLAESRFILGEDCLADIEAALDADPAHGWTRNLAGQYWMRRGDLARAEAELETAAAALGDDPALAVGRAELASLRGEGARALALLDAHPDDAACLNEKGLVLEREGRIEEAAAAYARAAARAPRDVDVLANLAAARIELDRFGDADEALAAALDVEETPRLLTLVGALGELTGQWVRSEFAFRKGLEEFGEEAELLEGYAKFSLARGKAERAWELAGRLVKANALAPVPDPRLAARAEELRARAEDAAFQRFACARCDRAWLVPRGTIDEEPLKVFRQPPDEAPAGKCPACGKVYCVGCVKDGVEDGRLRCPPCGEPLKLSEHGLRWLLRRHFPLADGD